MRRHLVWAVCVVVLGCLGATDAPPYGVIVTGDWSYTAERQMPVAGHIEGVLTVSRQRGNSFEGLFDGMESDDQQSRRVTGLVTGMVLDETTIDFEIEIDGTPRRHVGTLVESTLSGEWAVLVSGGDAGTFVAVKQ